MLPSISKGFIPNESLNWQKDCVIIIKGLKKRGIMKTIIKYSLIFCLLFSLKGIAQEPGDSYPIADKTTLKGKKELRREKKIKRHARRNTKKQEHLAAKKNKVKKYTIRLWSAKRKKVKNKEHKGDSKS
jgi:hypothetical protein